MKIKATLEKQIDQKIGEVRTEGLDLSYGEIGNLRRDGSLLSPQEIRNCSARMLGDEGAEFYAFLKELADDDDFKLTTQTLAQEDMEQKANEELILRFFAAKNARNMFRGSVRDCLDDFMENVLLKQVEFDVESEREIFEDLFEEISEKLGENAFVKFRGDKPLGGLAPAYFEAVSIGSFEALSDLKAKPAKKVRKAITDLVQSEAFRAVTGPGANNKTKLETRIALARDAIRNA